MQLEYIVETSIDQEEPRPLVDIKFGRNTTDIAECEKEAVAWFEEVLKRKDLNKEWDLALIEVNEIGERRQVKIDRASERENSLAA